MKKEYSKPCIAVENFLLQEFIAGSCNIKMNYATGYCVTVEKLEKEGVASTLASQIAGLVKEDKYFSSSCENMYSGTDASDGYCYFTATNAIFAS